MLPARARPTATRPIGATPSGWRAGCGCDEITRGTRAQRRRGSGARAGARPRRRAHRPDARTASALKAAPCARGSSGPSSAWTRRARALAAGRWTSPARASLLSFDEAQYAPSCKPPRDATGLTKMIEVTAAEAPWRTPPSDGWSACVACPRLDGVRADGGDRRLAALQRQVRSAPTSARRRTRTPPASAAPMGAITKAGNVHARRLLVEAAWQHAGRVTGRAGSSTPAGRCKPRRPPSASAPIWPTAACTGAGSELRRPPQAHHRQPPSPSRLTRRPLCRSLATLRSNRHTRPGRAGRAAPPPRARSDPRQPYEQPYHRATLEPRPRAAPDEHPVMRYPTRAYEAGRASTDKPRRRGSPDPHRSPCPNPPACATPRPPRSRLST